MSNLVLTASHRQAKIRSGCKYFFLRYVTVASIILSGCENTVTPETAFVIELPSEHELTIRNDPTLALSPDGNLLVYRADTGDDDIRQLYIQSLNERQGRILNGTQYGETPFFSPDGSRIGFFAEGMLKAISIEDGRIEVLSEAIGASGGYWDQANNITYAAGAIWQISANGGQAQRLNTFTGNEQYSWPSVLPDGQHIMYNLTNQGGQTTAIIIEDIDTGETWKVIDNGSYPRYLAGGYLLFSESGILKTVKIDPDKKNVESSPQTVLSGVLTSPATGAAQYALSDTGRLVYVPGTIFGKSRRLVMFDDEGNEYDPGLPQDRYSYVKYSPSGNHLAIEIEGDVSSIWLYEIGSGTMEKIVGNGTYPVWSPDGNRIAFSGVNAGRPGIYQVDVTRPQSIDVIIEDNYPLDHSYAWSPDGGNFAYTVINPTTGMDILMVPQPATTGPLPLLNSNFEECCPVFSADGRWLGYVTDITGRPEIHIVSFPDMEETHQISTTGAREPVWSQRDNTLYYWVDRQLMMLDLTGPVDFGNLSPSRILEGVFVSSSSTWRSRYDVKPEGDGIVILRRGPEETGINKLLQVTDINELILR